MYQLAFAFGQGLASGLLFFSLTYLAMSKQFGLKFSNFKIIGLLLLSSLCIGITQLILALSPEHTYIGIFSALGVPIIISAIIIFIAHRATLKKHKPK